MTLLHLSDVSLKFPGTEKPALKQINYSVSRGDFVIVLGSNGSGKSTLLKLLYRFHQANSGTIDFLGKAISELNSKNFSQHVRVLTQNCSDSLFSSLTLYENYLLAKQNLENTKKLNERKFLEQYLMDYNPNLSKKLDIVIDKLSGGEKQAFALALCLLQPPALLLLDEHTSALDPKTSQQIMQLTEKMISRHHITCLLTTHDLDIAMHYGNRILVLREGEIYKTFNRERDSILSKEMLKASCYF